MRSLIPSRQTFLSSLEERQKDCRLYIDKIGDILLANMENLNVYIVSIGDQLGSAIPVDPACAGVLRQPGHGYQSATVLTPVKPRALSGPSGKFAHR